MQIIPAIDIIEGKCVRLTEGDYAQKKIYNENPLEVAKAFEGIGLMRLHLVDLDGAKAGEVVNWKVLEKIAIGGWLEKTNIAVFDFMKMYMDKGVSQMFCTDIKKDGKLQGPSIELYEKIINQFPTLNLIASGGVSSLDDLIELEEIGCSAAIVGKAIYENKITINDLANFN